MNHDFQTHINQITKKPKIKYLDISNRDLAGNADLSEFTALISLNSYNNKFEDLTWLETLPNKQNLKKLNFFGNQLKEVDFAWLLSNFPNLESINIENNPVKTKNLNNLTGEQFGKLIQGIKEKKFRVVSWQGTILMDLLEYAKVLVARGNTNHNGHVVHLQSLIKEQPNEITEIQPKTEQNSSQIQSRNPNTNTYLLIGGLILLISSVLAIGYWLGKKQKQPKNKLYFDEN
jgi:hypothetical protein